MHRWSAKSNQDEMWFGISVGTAREVNGDNYSDVIVSAPYYAGVQAEMTIAFNWLRNCHEES